MGMVFKARDAALDRPVAIKFLRSEDPQAQSLFLMEARAQARLEHPNICQVFEVGEVRGRPFIAMQFVDGRPLTHFIDRMNLEQKVMVMAEVAEAVHAAHRLGLIHRDLKPSNILVEAEEDGGWKPFVLDFGLARETTHLGRAAPPGFQGTPAYMSPEQARGGVLDRRSDVYSLGATLYELLVGVPPFRGGTLQDMAERLQRESPLPMRELNPQLPEDLVAITERCLARDPVRRYDSARAVALELQRFLDGVPVQARGAGPGYRLRKWTGRNRLLASVIVVAFLACLGLAGMGLGAFYRARAEARLAQAFQREVGRMEAILRGSRSMPPHPVTAELDQVRERMHEVRRVMAAEGEPAAAPGGYALGRAYLLLGDPETARDHLQKAWDAGFRPPEVAAALGEALARIYQLELAEFGTVRSASRLFEPYSYREMHPETLLRLQREFRDPARTYLALGEASLTREQRLFFEGLTALHEGRPAVALRRAAAMAEAVPWESAPLLLQAEARRVLITLALREGRPEVARAELPLCEKAIQEARNVARSDPEVYEAESQYRYTVLFGKVLARQAVEADLRWALGATAENLKVDPGSWKARTHQAVIHLLWADYLQSTGGDPRKALDAAVEAAEEARRTKPDFLWAMNALATSLIARADVGRRFFGEDGRAQAVRARKVYEWMLRQSIFKDQVQMNLGQCDAVIGMSEVALGVDGTGRLQSSVACYDVAEKMNPGAMVAFLAGTPHKWMGLQAQWRGQDPIPHFTRSIEAYRRSLDKNPSHAGALGRLADLLVLRAEAKLEAGQDPLADAEEAAKAAERCIKEAPNLYLGHVNLGEALMVRARWEIGQGVDPTPILRVAELEIREALRTHPRDPEVVRDLAILAREELRWALCRRAPVEAPLAKGLHHVGETLACNPHHGYAHILKGQILLLAAQAGGAQADRRRLEGTATLARAVALNANLRAEAERTARTLGPAVVPSQAAR